jgi:hypothetical protein
MEKGWNLGAGLERRKKPRIAAPFPTRVRGIDSKGEAFEAESVLDNFSAGGLYVRLSQRVKEKAKLEFSIRMAGPESRQAATVKARGIVLRAEAKPGGVFGLAVKLTHHRFM